MKLGLLNTLTDGRGGGLNPDGLALDLQFATDKTLTARKGPTPVFTRASSATFVGGNGLIQSAATNLPRFDHTSAGVCRGLLIEESRTNICLQSENFGTTWTNDSGAVTITTDVEVSPDGLTTADKIAESTSTTNRRISIQSISVTSGTTYSYSCYIKAGERDFAQMATGTGLNSAFQNFIVNGANAGTLGSSSGIASSRIDAMPNGWYRCTIVVTATATGTTQVTVGPAPSSTITRWQAYSSTAGSGVFAWGAQVEAGSFATSYIPTTTGSVVRSADVCSITGGNFTSFWNQTEGSLFASAIFNSPANYNAAQFFCDVNDNTSQNRVRFYRNLTTPTFEAANISSNTQDAIITSSAQYASNVTHKASLGIKQNDYVFFANNATIGTDSSVVLPVNLNTFSIGNASSAVAARPTNGTLAAIRYYRKRLPNAKLQALTA